MRTWPLYCDRVIYWSWFHIINIHANVCPRLARVFAPSKNCQRHRSTQYTVKLRQKGTKAKWTRLSTMIRSDSIAFRVRAMSTGKYRCMYFHHLLTVYLLVLWTVPLIIPSPCHPYPNKIPGQLPSGTDIAECWIQFWPGKGNPKTSSEFHASTKNQDLETGRLPQAAPTLTFL